METEKDTRRVKEVLDTLKQYKKWVDDEQMNGYHPSLIYDGQSTAYGEAIALVETLLKDV